MTSEKSLKIIFVAILFTFIHACTPAKLTQPPGATKDNQAELRIYREKAFNSGGVKAIFGADNQDYFEIYNGNSENGSLPSGRYNFFVRSDQADNPFFLDVQLVQGETTCLQIFPNPNNLSKALLPFTYWLGNTFFLKIIECPADGNQPTG